MRTTAELFDALAAVAPIEGASVGRRDDRSSWEIQYTDEATAAQKKAAKKVLDEWDFDSDAPVAAADVKAAAARRIEAVMPDYAQRNALAMGLSAIMQFGPDPAAWPPELRALNDTIQVKWTEIKRLRAVSDSIEALDKIPEDFDDDGRWSKKVG